MANACLILDFDGTILDTEHAIFTAWSELWDEHGHELVLSDWQRNIGGGDVFDPWAELERRVGAELDPSLQVRRRRRRDEIQAGYGPRPGVLDWLGEAQDLGVRVGIASSSPIDWVEGHLQNLGILPYFSCLVCCDDTIPAKPEPTSYLIACERLQADPQCSVAVEDSPHGVAAASTAGLFTVAVPHALTEGLNFASADIVLTSLEELTLNLALSMAERHSPGRVRPDEV